MVSEITSNIWNFRIIWRNFGNMQIFRIFEISVNRVWPVYFIISQGESLAQIFIFYTTFTWMKLFYPTQTQLLVEYTWWAYFVGDMKQFMLSRHLSWLEDLPIRQYGSSITDLYICNNGYVPVAMPWSTEEWCLFENLLFSNNWHTTIYKTDR